MAADFEVKDPMNPTTAMKVVAVLSDTSWAVGATDAFYFSGQVSAPNRQDMQLATYLDLTNVETLFSSTCTVYDPVAKVLPRPSTPATSSSRASWRRNGRDLNLAASDMPSSEVQSPINYSFHIGVKPQPTEQNITWPLPTRRTLSKFWGVKQGDVVALRRALSSHGLHASPSIFLRHEQPQNCTGEVVHGADPAARPLQCARKRPCGPRCGCGRRSWACQPDGFAQLLSWNEPLLIDGSLGIHAMTAVLPGAASSTYLPTARCLSCRDGDRCQSLRRLSAPSVRGRPRSIARRFTRR